MFEFVEGILAALIFQSILIVALAVYRRGQLNLDKGSVVSSFNDDDLEKIDAVSRSKLRSDFANSLKFFRKSTEEQDLIWINSIVANIFCKWCGNEHLMEKISNFFRNKISNICSTYIGVLLLKRLDLEWLHFPSCPPTVRKPSVHKCGENGDFFSLFNLSINSNIHLKLCGETSFGQPFRIMATISELDASVYARFAKSRGIISWGLLEFPRYSLKLEVSEGIPDFLRGAIRASIWLFVRRKLVVPSVKSFKIKLKKNDGTAAEKKTDAVADDPGTLVLIENKKSILTKVTSKLRNRFSPVANYGRNSPDKLQPMTLGDDTNTVITNTEAAEDVTAFARELCEGIIERAIERIE